MKRLIIEVEKGEITIKGEKSCPKGEKKPLPYDEMLGLIVWAKHYVMSKLFGDVFEVKKEE